MRRNLLMTPVFCGVAWLAAAGVCAAGPWYIQTLDSAGDVGEYTSLALDVSGYPHISYFDAWPNEDLKYAAWNGSGWDIQTVDSDGYVGYYTSLALDASGYPHISYFDDINYDLKYAAWNGSSWDIQTVGSVGWRRGSSSLALDASGYPHISFNDSYYDLRYAAWNGSSWRIETVDSADRVGEFSSLALDASTGYPRITYYGNDDLKYAVWNGTRWDIQTVDSAGHVGRYTSVALEASGVAHISYYEGEAYYNLKYARQTGRSSWDIQTLDGAADVGQYTSLALDGSGYPHISYYDDTNDDLKYAAWDGSSWDIATVDSAGDVGLFTSLALDASSGYAHISYHDWTNRDLKYATTRPPAEASHELLATGYYMISLPLTPTLATPHDLLSDDLGDGNYYMWRWEAGGYQTVPTSLPESQATTLSAQQGYWLLAHAATLDMDVGGVLPHGNQSIPLQAGWNMVAAPYEAAMDSLLVDNAAGVRSLEEAELANWVLATFYYSHDGTGSYSTLTINQTPPDALSLWYGYWVLAGLDCSLIVPPPSGGAGGTARRTAERTVVQPAWAFDIQVSSGDSADRITIAAADAASDDFDGFALDRPKPPAAPGEGRVRVVLRAEGWRGTVADAPKPLWRRREPPPYNKAPGRQMPWASELATETKGTAQEDTEWELTVSGGVGGEQVTLSWPELSRLPKDRVPILIDRDTGKRTFMRTRAQYEFSAPGEGASRGFTVTVKRAQEGALLISGLTALPTRAGTWDIGFNLSADAAVDAHVYNVAGRRVADIANGATLGRGRASLTWNARSLTDTAVPTGTYLLRLTARTRAGEQASAVTVLQVQR